MALHELDEPPFDAAVAVVSLHHVEPLDESFERSRRRAAGRGPDDRRGRLRAFDERAARWWLDQHHDHPGDPAEMVAGVRGHMHSLARLCEALAPWFELGEPVRGAYLYRWEMPPGMREPEEALIATGDLPATGARLVGIRRP